MTNEARTLFEKLGLHTCQKYFKTRWLQGGITARIYVQGKEEPLTTIIGSDWKAFGSEANKNKINKAISNEYDIENVSVRLSLGFRSKGNDSDAWYTFVLNHVLPEVKAVVPENSLFKTIQGVEIVFEVVEGVPSEQLGALRKLNSDAKKKVGVLFKQDPRFSFSLKFIYHKKIEISENNREGWVKGAEEIKNTEISFKKLYRTDAIIVAYFIFVHLSKDNDTTNLRYFLPLLHYLNNTENRICKLYLHVDARH